MSIPANDRRCRICHTTRPIQWFWNGKRHSDVCHRDDPSLIGRTVDSVLAFAEIMDPSRNNQPILYDRIRHTWLVSEKGIIQYETDDPATAEHLRFSIIRHHLKYAADVRTISELQEILDGES